MSRYSVVPVAVISIVCLAPAIAPAADMEGRVHNVDAVERTVTLDNGTKIWFSEGVGLETIPAGAEVKVSYEDKDGKPVGTSIEVK
jgi:hypothetical protein